MAVEARVLGPLKICVDGREVDLGGVVDRRIIGTLLLSSNQPVSIDTLMLAAWDVEPPRTARRQIQNRIGGLRARLARVGMADHITTSQAGYQVELAPDQ